MRIWHCSVTARIDSVAGALVSRSLNASRGAAAEGTISAPSTAICRSGTAGPPSRRGRAGGALLQAREEGVDILPDGVAARQPTPAGSDQADQQIALIDRRQVVVLPAADAVHQQ